MKNEFDREADLLPYSYSYEIRIMGRDDMKDRGSGTYTGFRIDGKTHSISSGPGYCYLNELNGLPENKGHKTRHIDVRNRKKIETDDHGDIKIFRRKLQLTLPGKLNSLIAFLNRIDDSEIRVFTTENAPNMTDLIRAYAKGGGMDDWAGEILFEMGEEGQNELLRRLENVKSRRDHLTIAELLLMVFPSKKSREAVENALERETNPDKQKMFALLLGATQNLP